MAGVLRKNIWFSVPVPKIKFDPPPQEKSFWCSYFKSFIKSKKISRCGNFVDKWNFVSTSGKIIILLGNSCYQLFFHQILKNCHFGVKKNHYPPRWICMTHIRSPTLFPGAIIIFQGVQTKFHFLTKFPHIEKLSI